MSKKVLVTGGDGFIGSHLVEFLVSKGYDVRALAIYNSNNDWGWLETSEVKNKIEIVMGDVRDPFLCKEITKGIDTVYHLAALIAIPYSYRAPHSYIETNINGTTNLCMAAMENGVKRFMHTSTSEVYGTAQYVPINEIHPLQPQSPYSASKIAADAMAMSFHNSFGFPLSIARPFNTYGPRQSARAVIPTIISQMLAGKKQIKIGDIKPTRDFNYVGDTVNGMYLITNSSESIGETINIGSGFEISIEDTFQLIKKITGSQAKLLFDNERVRPEKSEVNRLWCDNSKISKLTSFKPEYTFEAGLRKTIEWFSNPENLKRYKVEIYNV